MKQNHISSYVCGKCLLNQSKMAKIFLSGENHFSKEDAERIRSFDFSKIKDGIFFSEGREEDMSIINLFLLGYKEYNLVYHIIRHIIRIPSLDDFIEKKSKRWRFEIDKKVDAPVSNIYSFANRKHKTMIFSVIFLFFLFLASVLSVIKIHYFSYGSFPLAFDLLSLAIVSIYTLGIPFIYFGLIISLMDRDRDMYMAGYIDKKIKKENYDRAMVRCGNDHVGGIRNYLEDKGHSIEVSISKHDGKRAKFYYRIRDKIGKLRIPFF